MNAPLVIELRANETVSRAVRANLPVTPEEVVAGAVAARRAGASILHWHARDRRTGEPSNDVGLYVDVYRGVREQTDLILHPTLGYLLDQDPIGRTRHIAHVNNDPAVRVDLAPVDFGSINVDHWDPEARRFVTEDLVYLNLRRSLRRMLETLAALGVPAVSVCWNPGQIRTALRFREMRLLGRTLWEFVFTGETVPDGMPATRIALEAMVEQIPAGEPWSVICWNGNVLQMARWAIELGGHVSVGLGDWGYDELGSPRNEDIVAHVAAMATAAGRPIASPDDVRTLLGLPGRRESADASAPQEQRAAASAVSKPACDR
jgi:uncharacterized protein (DUF849 family)